MKINPIDKSALPQTGGDLGTTFSSKQPGKTSQELFESAKKTNGNHPLITGLALLGSG